MKKYIISILMLFIVCASAIALQPMGSIISDNSNTVDGTEYTPFVGDIAKQMYQDIINVLSIDDQRKLQLGRSTSVGGATCNLQPDETYDYTTITGQTQLCVQNNNYVGMAAQLFLYSPWTVVGSELHILKGERSCWTVQPLTKYRYTIYYCNQVGTTSCTETDSGRDYTKYGTTTFTSATGTSSSYSDNCLSLTSLQERFCDSSKTVQSESIDCTTKVTNGQCVSGACISVAPNCPVQSSKGCYGNSVYWYDCNGVRKDLVEDCGTTATCNDVSKTCVITDNPTCSQSSLNLCTSQSACEAVSGYWYNSACNKLPKDYKVIPTNVAIDTTQKYTFGETVNFGVTVKTDSPTDIQAYVEVGIYCGQLKDYLGLSRTSFVSRSYSVVNQTAPCVAAEKSFVTRKLVTIKSSDGEKTINDFGITVPKVGTMGGSNNNMSNYATPTDGICYIRAHVFDKCSPDTSSRYLDGSTELKQPFDVYTGSIIKPEDIVCCDTRKTTTDVLNQLKYVYDQGDYTTIHSSTETLYDSELNMYNLIFTYTKNLWNSLFTRSVSLDFFPTKWDGQTVIMRTTAQSCKANNFVVVDTSIADCKGKEEDVGKLFQQKATELMSTAEVNCTKDSDCPTKISPKCDLTTKKCTFISTCVASYSCTKDLVCTDGTTISKQCVSGCYVDKKECPLNVTEPSVPSVSLTTDGKKFCLETGTKGTQCYYRKYVMDISDVKNLDRLNVFTYDGKTYLAEPTNPLCLIGIRTSNTALATTTLIKNADYQCEADGECLRALNSNLARDADNKAVYDGLSNVVYTNRDKLNAFLGTVTTLGIKDLFLWTIDVSPKDEQVQQFGVCVYKDRDFISKIKKFIADTFKWDIDDPKVTYVMYGGAAAIVLFLFMLLKPERPRYYTGGG